MRVSAAFQELPRSPVGSPARARHPSRRLQEGRRTRVARAGTTPPRGGGRPCGDRLGRRATLQVRGIAAWRHEVAAAACRVGADVVNDAWGGWDRQVAEVAAHFGAALVCTHAGGLPPRTRPHRIGYDDVMADVLRGTVALAERAVAAG